MPRKSSFRASALKQILPIPLETTFDYIFICIGDTMTSLQLNQLFSMRKYRAFYSWVEPLVIAH